MVNKQICFQRTYSFLKKEKKRFIVCELCPLFVKRVGLLQVKNPLVE